LKNYKLIGQEITARFIEAVEYLLENERIKSKAELGRELGYKSQYLNNLFNASGTAPLGVLMLFVKNYNVNLEWLFFGLGPIQGESEEFVQNDGALYEIIQAQKETIQTQKEFIKHLQKDS